MANYIVKNSQVNNSGCYAYVNIKDGATSLSNLIRWYDNFAAIDARDRLRLVVRERMRQLYKDNMSFSETPDELIGDVKATEAIADILDIMRRRFVNHSHNGIGMEELRSIQYNINEYDWQNIFQNPSTIITDFCKAKHISIEDFITNNEYVVLMDGYGYVEQLKKAGLFTDKNILFKEGDET